MAPLALSLPQVYSQASSIVYLVATPQDVIVIVKLELPQ